jgi:hypothetical protein
MHLVRGRANDVELAAVVAVLLHATAAAWPAEDPAQSARASWCRSSRATGAAAGSWRAS